MSAPPCLIAFDTSTERMAVALQSPAGTALLNEPGGAAASATLLPQVARLLAGAGLAHADLGFVAFGRGPGAFTGLRTACAVAQGLAFGIGRPVLPIDSLLIVAEDARVQAGATGPFDVGVAMDARMNELYAAAYRFNGTAWQVLREPALLALPALAPAWAGLALDAVAGSAWAAFGDQLARPGARVYMQEQDRAAALLRLAQAAAAAGEGVDAALALPIYLRDKVAQTTREREAARAALAG
jgi:tRNA threonylcarbamoyladenosine biosynthesis protein TsaB